MLVSMEMVENVLDVNGLDLITIMVMFWVERLFFVCLLVKSHYVMTYVDPCIPWPVCFVAST